MITPLQQTPLPLDPVRQQITPTPPVEPPPPLRQPDTPVQASDSSQDTFNQTSEDNRDNRHAADLTAQQRIETFGKLRSAYLRLNELQREAGAALASGNASLAKELAAEAAGVAQTIPASVGFLQMTSQVSTASPASDSTTEVDLPASFDIARAGLGAAKDVIETAASIPYHPVADRIAINGMRHQVLDAMAGVENIAAQAAAFQAAAAPAEKTAHVDFKA